LDHYCVQFIPSFCNAVSRLSSGVYGLGGVVFLSLGGFLADVNWQMPFLIYLLALLIFPLVVFVLPEPDRTAEA